jgi:MFS family permease
VPSWPERLSPLRERDFLLLFVGRTVSLFGTALAPIALAFGVLEIGGSASDLGLVVAAGSLPMVVFLLVGGIWADRLPRHHVMVASDAASAVAQAVVAVLFLTGRADVWHLIALSAIRGAAAAFFFPAAQGIIPQVVSATHLQEANALLRLSRNGAQIGGTALAGVLVAVAGPGWALALDAATYVLGAAFLVPLRLPRSETLSERRFLRELREGWDEFRSRTWLWAIVLQFAFMLAAAVGAWSVLGPIVADRSLGGAPAWSLIVAAQSTGFLAGGLLVLRWRPARPLLVATLAIFAMAPPLFLLAGPAPTLVIAAGAFAAGFGIELFGVFWDLTMQEQIPPEALSRVSSYDALGSFIFVPLGAAVVGPLADAVGVAETLIGAGLVVVIATAAVLLVDDVRNLRRREDTPAAAKRLAGEQPVGAEGPVA